MFIQTEKTPNPQTIKFMPLQDASPPARGVWGSGEWKNNGEVCDHPLPTLLFSLPGVISVFLGDDFIAITKNDQFNWEQIKPDILSALMDFFSAGGAEALVAEKEKCDAAAAATAAPTGEESEITKKIKEILATRVQPAVAQDGGDIQLDRFENGIAYLNMRGACAGCPSSTQTLKNGVENLLRYYVPELERVEANEVF